MTVPSKEPHPTPIDLDDGLVFEKEGFSLRPAETPAGSVAQVRAGKLLWPNPYRDTDAVAAPLPDGVEALWVLRSPHSPTSFGWRVTLPAGAELRPGPATGAAAEIVRDGSVIGRIGRPFAVDAAGRPVPTAATVEGDRVSFEVAHRGEATRYPVVVDPTVTGALVESSLSPTSGGWTFSSSAPGLFSGQVGSGSLGTGQYVDSQAGATFADGDSAAWRYRAPGSAYVYRFDAMGAAHVPAQGAGPSCLMEGIYNAGDWELSGEWTQGGAVGGSGPWTTCAAVSADTKTHCARPGCAWGGAAGNSAAVQLSMSGGGQRSSEAARARRSWAAPTSTSPTARTPTWPAVRRRRSGIGRGWRPGRSRRVTTASASGPLRGAGPGPSAARRRTAARAFRTRAAPRRGRPTRPVDTATLSEGENAVTLRATDAVDRTSAALDTVVRVDRGAPAVDYYGPLASLDGRTVAEDQVLTVQASDGDAEQRRSGVRSVEVLVDGVRKSFTEQSCGEGSCSMRQDWTLKPAEYTPGEHVVRAVVLDGAGNQSERSWTVFVGTGRITSVLEGARTARRLLLQARGTGGQSGVRFQYRTSKTGTWTDIPTNTVRQAGVPVASWPVGLADGLSPALVWNLTSAAGETGMNALDGAVQIRGVFDGGQGGNTQDVNVTVDTFGIHAKHATAPIGPGEVDLLTGGLSFTTTDAKVDASKADLVVTRTYSSRGGGALLGPGWEVGMPVNQSAFRSVQDLSESEEWAEPYALVFGSDGEELTFAESGEDYKSDPGFEHLKLRRISPQGQPRSASSYELTDTKTGEVSVFTRIGAGAYRLDHVRMTGEDNKTIFTYTGNEVKRIIATPPPGVDCEQSLVRGCQALEFDYIGDPDSRRLVRIKLITWDPATQAMKTTTVQEYTYDSTNRLFSADDPRDETDPYTFFYTSTSAASPLLSIANTPTSGSWEFAYQASAGELNPGRLRSAKRAGLVGGNTYQTYTVVYDVPRTGSGAPYQMGAGDIAAWGQEVLPTDATAIFRPDDVPADPPASYQRATIHYIDAHGRQVNVARPGGFVEATEGDRSGNVVRELSAANRKRALDGGGDTAASARELDTQRTFAQDAVRLLDELGPLHEVRLPGGATVQARRHTTHAYDEGAPSTGGPYNLPTTTTVGARQPGAASDEDVRTTKTDYAWSLRQPTKVTVDPAGLNLQTTTVYDAATGQVVERRMPRNPSGGDASTTRTVLFTAAANAQDGDCGLRPEWAGLPCKTGPAAQPGTAGLPALATSRYEYGYLRGVTRQTDESGGVWRTTEQEFDASGRVTARTVTSTVGASVPAVSYTYNDMSGRIDRIRATDGSGNYDFSQTFDTHGRLTAASTSAPGQTGFTFQELYYYDLVGRLLRRNTGTSTQNFTYDPVRGTLSRLEDQYLGNIDPTWDADGRLVDETFQGAALTATTSYDETGAPVRRSYVKANGCTSNCTWQDSAVVESIHGQWVSHDGTQSDQTYAYDAAGRLTRTGDDVAGQGCTTRTYAYDADSNRTSLTTNPPDATGACSLTTSGDTVSHAHDAADRLTDSGIEYDAFGRVTALPASRAGGQALSTSYYANDRVRTLTQGGHSSTVELDGLLRPRERRAANAGPETIWYADDSDRPAVTQDANNVITRYITGAGGDLAGIVRHDAGTTTSRLQLSNLHGDIVGEAALSTTATQPTERWETDEFGVPRKPAAPDPIQQVGASSAANTIASSTLQIAKPAGTQAGDVLVFALATVDSYLYAPPEGWTSATYNPTGSGSSKYAVYWRVATDSEPADYSFTLYNQAKHRGGIIALRGVDTSQPIQRVETQTGPGGDATIAATTPARDNSAILTLVGADAGDADGASAWGLPGSLTAQWDIATGTTSSDKNQTAGFQVLINHRGVSVPAASATQTTGLPAAAWATQRVVINPKPPTTTQYRYRYLGKHERALELPTGTIAMGARAYTPQLGRFLQTDPIYGGSANAYDYANQDPVNLVDLDGEMPADNSGAPAIRRKMTRSTRRTPLLPSCRSTRKARRGRSATRRTPTRFETGTRDRRAHPEPAGSVSTIINCVYGKCAVPSSSPPDNEWCMLMALDFRRFRRRRELMVTGPP